MRERSDVLTLFLVGNINRVPGEGGGRVDYIKNEYALKKEGMEWCSKVESRIGKNGRTGYVNRRGGKESNVQQAVDHEVEVSRSGLVGEVGSPQEYVKSGCTCTQKRSPKEDQA